MSRRKIIIAVTGASGSLYADMLIKKVGSLSNKPSEVALVFTSTALDIWKDELPLPLNTKEFEPPFRLYSNDNMYAPFASGSSLYDTMIIIPASMGMTGRIASGISDDLISRAADVMLKERRKLILVPRETPYSLVHLNNMKLLTEAGAVICPATPSFYHKPSSIEDLVMTVVDRILDLCGFEIKTDRWGEVK